MGDILLSVDSEAIDGTTFSVTPTLEERDRQVVDLMPLFQGKEPGGELERRLSELQRRLDRLQAKEQNP